MRTAILTPGRLAHLGQVVGAALLIALTAILGCGSVAQKQNDAGSSAGGTGGSFSSAGGGPGIANDGGGDAGTGGAGAADAGGPDVPTAPARWDVDLWDQARWN